MSYTMAHACACVAQTRTSAESHRHATVVPLNKSQIASRAQRAGTAPAGSACSRTISWSSGTTFGRRLTAASGSRADFRNTRTTISAVAEAAPSSTGASEELWKSVKKELLSIGKNGVAQSHKNSLKDLLAQHPEGVKVKLNHTAVDAELAIANLTDETGATFVQRKGQTLLFASDDLESRPPPAVSTFTRQTGQWICASCAFDNFSSRTKCFKCSEPKEPKEPAV